MSQFWHAHWAEDSYKPARLGNWQVPNWHPKFPCRHCTTTTFLADSSGRLLPDLPRPKRSPWGNFKGTWELPLKIDRNLARILSAPSKYKIAAWEAHKKYRQGPCEKTEAISRKMQKKVPAREFVAKKSTPIVEKKDIGQTVTKSGKPTGKNLKTTVPKRPEQVLKRKKAVNEKGLMEEEEIFAQDQKDDQLDQEDNFQPSVEEKNVEKLYPEELKDKEKSNCLCVYKNEPRLPVEFAQKVIRKNICTVHQRLRV